MEGVGEHLRKVRNDSLSTSFFVIVLGCTINKTYMDMIIPAF